MRTLRVTGFYLVLFWAVLLIFLPGCKKEEPKTDTTSSMEPEKPTEKGVAPTEPPPTAPPDKAEPTPEQPTHAKPTIDNKREKLATAFVELYCAQRRNDASNLLEIYTKHGFDTPATFSKEWDRTATDDSEWAETVISGAMASDCAVANP